MLPLSANSDFKNINNYVIDNPYIDINGKSPDGVVYGVDALDQAIEAVICTMPGERLFNLTFYSPLYDILYNNYVNEQIVEQIYNKIEEFVPVRILRERSKIYFDSKTHTLNTNIPYMSMDGRIVSEFKRRLKK